MATPIYMYCCRTHSVKTEFVKRIIKNLKDMITSLPTRIVWSYGEWQPAYQPLLDKVDFVQGLPDLPLYSKEPLLVVIHDEMHGVDRHITSLFTKGGHHRNLSIVYIVQNLFHQQKEHCTISLNSHYLVIIKNPRDGSQIVHLVRQMYPGKTHYLGQALALATRQPHGYHLVDLKQATPEGMRLRSHIFPVESQEVYVEDI